MSDLSNPIFHDAEKARKWLEGRIWLNGPICPHCGEKEDFTKLEGKAHRPGLHQCNNGDCRKQFTVTVGTVFERSKIPLNKWLMATYLLSASKKGMSTRQLSRMLKVSVKSTWFMTHRIREAMKPTHTEPMGGSGGIVEVDETFIGNDRTKKPYRDKKGRGYEHKYKVLSLVDRETGEARSIVVDNLKAKTLVPILKEQIGKNARIYTDEAGQYKHIHRDFADHQFIRHGRGEYVRGPVHTNTIEGFFSIFKRGMKGTYQHCGKHHLARYTTEFDFRYSTREMDDLSRTGAIVSGAVGKRLTYRRTSDRANQ